MLIAGQVIYGSALEGADGTLGNLQDLYYHGESWEVKYIVADTGGWLDNHRVLVSPAMVQRQDWVERRVWVPLSREQVEKDLPNDVSPPPSGAQDSDLTAHPFRGGYGKQVATPEVDLEKEIGLHSSRRTVGYRVEAYDGEVGVVKDLIVEDQSRDHGSWEIRYLAVDARKWLPDRFVLISPLWADSLFWETHKIRVAMLRETIRHSPHYDPLVPIGRAYEEVLHEYYGMPKYWMKYPVSSVQDAGLRR